MDGLLYKRHDTNSKLTMRLQLVVPEKFREVVMTANHSTTLSGHLGFGKLSAKFYNIT